MIKNLAGAFVALTAVAAASSAGAATYTYATGTLSATLSFAPDYTGTVETFNELTATSTNGSGYNSGSSSGPLSILGGAGSLTLNGAQIVNGAGVGEYAPPNPFTPDPTNYLSVYGGGSATFTLTQGVNAFGIVWGSVDSSNALSFYGKNGNLLGTVYGSNVAGTLPGVNTTGGPGAGTNWNPGGTVFADITSSAPIYSVVATSGQNSFEFDHVAVSPVPLPAALPLFGAALAGLGAFGGWRKSRRNRVV